MKLLQLLTPHLEDAYGITNADFYDAKNVQEAIYRDILHGHIKDRRAGAKKYCDGVINTFDSIVKRIDRKACQLIATHDSPKMNGYQRALHQLRIKHAATEDLIQDGLRDAAMYLAKDVYTMAVRNHVYHIAYRMAVTLSNNAARNKDYQEAEKYHNRSKLCLKNMIAADEALYRHGQFEMRLSDKRVVTSEAMEYLEQSIDYLQQQSQNIDSYHYKYRLSLLQIYKAEAQSKYVQVIELAYGSYEYFMDLHFDHKSAKALMMSHVYSGYVGLSMYQHIIDLRDKALELSGAGVNYDILLIRLMQAYLNLSQPDHALEIYEYYKDYHSDHKANHNIVMVLRAYARLMRGDTTFDPDRLEPIRKDRIHLRILSFWRSIQVDLYGDEGREKKTLQYVRRNLGDTRAGIFLRLLCTLRYASHNHSTHAANVRELETRLAEAVPDASDEAELIDFSTLWKMIKVGMVVGVR